MQLKEAKQILKENGYHFNKILYETIQYHDTNIANSVNDLILDIYERLNKMNITCEYEKVISSGFSNQNISYLEIENNESEKIFLVPYNPNIPTYSDTKQVNALFDDSGYIDLYLIDENEKVICVIDEVIEYEKDEDADEDDYVLKASPKDISNFIKKNN